MNRILMVDVGGGSVKLMVSGRRAVRSFETGDHLTAADMVRAVQALVGDWSFERISIGYPGPIRDGLPIGEPPRIGTGWVDFDYPTQFGKPVRMINDASLQALGAYRGGRMLFLGLGTGLGSTLIADDVLVPLELGWLRFDAQRSLLQQLADDSPQRLGLRRWRHDVLRVVGDLKAAFSADDIVLGGGNAARLTRLPKFCRTRSNTQGMSGALRLWGDAHGVRAIPRGTVWNIRGMR
jgi:polyphosphate glucokinase